MQYQVTEAIEGMMGGIRPVGEPWVVGADSAAEAAEQAAASLPATTAPVVVVATGAGERAVAEPPLP